jgi:hypothetical protein
MEQPAFILGDQDLHRGHLGYQANDSPIGIGAFKTAHHARLTVNPLVGTGIGTVANEHIVMKRPYYNKGRPQESDELPDQRRIARYTVTDELTKVTVEANILIWATCLMSVTYGFIDRFLGKSHTTVPFNIPRMRFVKAGIAVGQQAISRRSTARAGYLLEEYIDPANSQQGPFIKYIHNSNAIPLSEDGEIGYDTALFLCFAQHVQYEKTGHLAYVSDFQGER